MPPIAPVVLEGAHVRLEPLTLAHLDALAALGAGHAEDYRLTSVPVEAAGMQGYLASALAQATAGTALPFATLAVESREVLGSTRFCNAEFWSWPEGHPLRRPPGVPDAVEVGYTWLAPGAQRTAVNTEAKLLMLRHAFEAWEVHRVTLKTDVRNARSRAAIERLGAHLDGVLRAAVPASDGGIRDTAYYSLLRAEWPAACARLMERLARGGSPPPHGAASP
jgi:N-acetyltransferase